MVVQKNAEAIARIMDLPDGIVVIVCGGRDFGDVSSAYRILDSLHALKPIRQVRHGDARGADRIGGAWARSRGIKEDSCPADWERHGKAAGVIRNQEMLDREPLADVVLVFPGGRGTADMCRRVAAAGIPLIDLSTFSHARR